MARTAPPLTWMMPSGSASRGLKSRLAAAPAACAPLPKGLCRHFPPLVALLPVDHALPKAPESAADREAQAQEQPIR